MISNKLQVKWELQGDYVQIELLGRIREDQYMAFGLSGAQGRPQMVSSRARSTVELKWLESYEL